MVNIFAVLWVIFHPCPRTPQPSRPEMLLRCELIVPVHLKPIAYLCIPFVMEDVPF